MSNTELMQTVEWLRRGMPRHMFFALCLSLLLLCPACRPTLTEDDLRVRHVVLFLPGRTKFTEELCDAVPTKHVKYVFGSFLVAGNGVMVALAEAQYTEDGNSVVDIVAKYIDTEGENWADKTTENHGVNWKIKLAMQRKEEGINYSTKSLGAVIKGNKIYLLALSGEGNGDHQTRLHWRLKLVVAEIVSGGGSKTLEWRPSGLLSSRLMQRIGKYRSHLFPGSVHSAFVTSKGAIVFSVGYGTDVKWNVVLLGLKDDEEQWKMSFIWHFGTCRFISFLEWKEKLILIDTGCPNNSHYVREYDEVSKRWKYFNGTLFRPGQNLSNSRGFITASIENVTVLLYTEAYANVASANRQWGIRLWVTDGSHFYDAGVIATEYTEVVSWGLAYTNGALFSLHQRTRGISGPIVFTRLDRQLSGIRSKVKVWVEESFYFSGSPLP